MKRTFLVILTIICFQLFSYAQTIKTPEEFFGFRPGSDRNVFRYEQLVEYLQELDRSSDRILMKEVGKSPMGKPMYLVFISSEENISNLDELKKINRELAINSELSDNKLDEYIGKGKVFLMATLSMHSTEVGPAQAAPLTAYDLCTTTDPLKLKWMDDVVYMFVPNHNPDGMDMVVDYYNKTKGTKYEGASLPGVYHKYVGHDNNRDFVILSQEDTKVISSIYSTEWYPQVFVEKHQMGSTSARYFVPPNHDPIAVNIDEGLWDWSGIFGANMIKDMTRDGHSGITQNSIFDNYWPGSTETSLWLNIISLLTEAASVRVATPIYVDPTELSARGKGLSEYKKGNNLRLPWPGGDWKLSDIVNYELSSIESLLKTSSLHKADILTYRNHICKKMVELGKTSAPYYYILPLEQHDQGELVKLVRLLQEHGVKVYSLSEDLMHEGRLYSGGDIIVPLSQPYRAFIKEVMESQQYPEKHYTPGGELIKPYDIATWSLPLHNGLTSVEINTPVKNIGDRLQAVDADYLLVNSMPEKNFLLFPIERNESYEIAFRAVEKGYKVKRTLKDIEVEGKKVSAGSFILQRKKNNEFTEFIKTNLTVSPVELDKEPESVPFSVPAIALVESWFHDMDAGWTRFVFDSYHIPFEVLRPADIKTVDLSKYDVIIFPDENPSILLEGKYKSGDSYYIANYAPEYTKGMEKEGKQKLMEFLNNGGNIVAWGGSTLLFQGMHTIKLEDGTKEEFNLPFTDISKQLVSKGLYCPGSLVNLKLKQNSDITAGMPENCGVFYRGEPVFQTGLPYFDMDREVIGVVPEENILLSGYAENEEKLGSKALLIRLVKGEGQLVLMAFNPQFRSSTHTSFKLLFNSILLD